MANAYIVVHYRRPIAKDFSIVTTCQICFSDMMTTFCAWFFLTLSPVLLAKLFALLPSQENPLNKWIVPGCLELPCQMIEMNVHRKEIDFLPPFACSVVPFFFLIIVPCHHQLLSKIIMQIHYEQI